MARDRLYAEQDRYSRPGMSGRDDPPRRFDAPPQRRQAWQVPLLVVLVVLVVGGGAATGLLLLLRGADGDVAQAPVAAGDAGGTGDATTAAPVSPAAAPATPVAQAAPAPEPAQVAPQAADAPAPVAAPVTQAFDDWVLACPPDDKNSLQCVVQQQVRSSDGKRVLLVWTFRKDAQGAVHGVWLVAPDARPEQGVVMDTGDGKPRRLPIADCTARSCRAQAVLTADYLASLEQAATISATVSLASQAAPARLALSSKGLAAALAQIAAGQ